MIFIDDTDTYLVARSRREAINALLDHLPAEPELWQMQMIAAACLGRQEVLDVAIVERDTHH